MIDFLKNFIDNYSLIQSIYALLPYVIGIVIAILYAKFYLKQTKYFLFILPLLIQGIASFKLYLFNYQIHLNLFDYSSLYLVTLPLILASLVTIITFSKVTTIVKSKKANKSEIRKDLYKSNLYIVLFTLALEAISQYFYFDIYAYIFSTLPSLLAVITLLILVKNIIKD